MIQLEIVTPKKVWYNGKVSEVLLPGIDGDFTVLDDHAPVLSTLRAGPLVLVADDLASHFVIEAGLCSVENNKVSVLTEGCEPLGEPDQEELENEVQRKEQELAEAGEEEEDKVATLKEDLTALRCRLTTLMYKINEY